jgi:nucleotidyltransferase/DNA polymerase involved in DNA repair
MQHLFSLTDSVEQISIDEAFLEVTDHSEPVWWSLRNSNRHHRTRAFALFNWRSSNKLVAKLLLKSVKPHTGEMVRQMPSRWFPWRRSRFSQTIAPDLLWGVGPRHLLAFRSSGSGPLATSQPIRAGFNHLFGKNGYEPETPRSGSMTDRYLCTTSKSISQRSLSPRHFGPEILARHLKTII